MSVPVLVAVAWPYASGSRHLGHLAGAYLPADVFARHQRIVGNEVLMVSGSDVHGTPITVRADAEGVSPSVIVDRYHTEFVRQWEDLGFSWDLFTTTGTDNHAQVTQEMFLAQLQNGHIDRRVSEQYYDPTADRFLPDRYIEGTCPHCAYTEARGDQCDNCGQTLDALDLGDPRSKISGATPERRETEHFYFRYSDFTERLAEIYKDKVHWRPHVLNFVRGYLKEGLLDRAITRDIEWGIELPVDDLGPGKRIYVWYDAVIGYLSASKEWSAQQGDDDAWRRWWENDQSRHVYFIGKDNIPVPLFVLASTTDRCWPPSSARRCARQSVRHLQGWEGVGEPRCWPDYRRRPGTVRTRRAALCLGRQFSRASRYRSIDRVDRSSDQRRTGCQLGEPRQPGVVDAVQQPWRSAHRRRSLSRGPSATRHR